MITLIEVLHAAKPPEATLFVTTTDKMINIQQPYEVQDFKAVDSEEDNTQMFVCIPHKYKILDIIINTARDLITVIVR